MKTKADTGLGKARCENDSKGKCPAVDYCKMFVTSKLGNHSGCCTKQCSVLFSKVGNVTLRALELVPVADILFLSL